MEKKYLIYLIMLFVLPLVNASITISPNPIDIETQVHIQKDLSVSLTNNYSFEVLDFQFSNLSDYGFSFPDFSLKSNETKSINFQVLTTESAIKTINSLVSFKYYVDLPEEIQTYHINITENGFEPNYLLVRDGDTVVWTNFDEISHTVTSSLFDESLLTNGTFSYTFSGISTIDYQDLNLFYTGTIEVVNRTTRQKAHNPNLDFTWNVNINSALDPTYLHAETLEKNFSIPATGSSEGIIQITNNGTEIADRVHLSSNSKWIEFDENNFTLSIGQKKYIKYTVAPAVFTSNETNKTYNIEIRVKAFNTEELILPISVFVPYSEIFTNITSDEGFLLWFTNVYCKLYPNLFICNTSVKGSGETKVIIKDPELPINMTALEKFDLMKRIQRIEDSNQRTDNKVNLMTSSFEEFKSQQLGISNESLELQKENEKNERTRKNANWIIGTGIIVAVCIVAIAFLSRKYLRMKSISEGSYKFKK